MRILGISAHYHDSAAALLVGTVTTRTTSDGAVDMRDLPEEGVRPAAGAARNIGGAPDARKHEPGRGGSPAQGSVQPGGRIA